MSAQGHPELSTHDVPRAQRLLTLEFGSRAEFGDPQLEYRRLFSELLGTLMLVLVAAGGGILHAKGQISLAAAVVAPGLMVLAIILSMGAGPLVGAAIAVGCVVILRGRGGDPASRAAGSGVPTPGRQQEKARLSQDIDRGKVAPTGPDQAVDPRAPNPRHPRPHPRVDEQHHGRFKAEPPARVCG
jgi:hypothetical protein